jgi:hypothetical protein
MPVDPEYLRQHYAVLSDEALLDVVRADLVPVAQKLYDEEMDRRELGRRRQRKPDPQPEVSKAPEPVDPQPKAEVEQYHAGEKPDWLEDAAEIHARADRPGMPPTDDIADAQQALKDAGIPCYLQMQDVPEKEVVNPATRVWRVLVPGHLGTHAMSIIERDILNEDFADGWRTQLETLTDKELRAMTPQVAFCGLFDRVERVTRAYDEELARRGLKAG